MRRKLDELRSKQDQFIHTLYSVTQGDTCTCGDVRKITQKLGFDRLTCASVVSYFVKKGIIKQCHESLSYLVTLTSEGVDFVEVTFSAASHIFDSKLTDFADGAACLFYGPDSRVLKE